MPEPPPPGDPGGSRGAFFAARLEHQGALQLTEGREGLGLALRRAAAKAEEIYRTSALAVHRHDARCEEVEAICKARPCFLPPSCYCAALSSLLQSTAESDLLHNLLSLSKPDRIARRAPGISSGHTGPCDVTALEILRKSSDLAEDLLPLYSDLARIWKYNAFDTGDGRLAIFLLPSLCNHSCLPAAEYTLCDDDDGNVEMLLFSLRDLEAGDPLTICYIEDNEKHRTRVARRNTLAEGWLFYCTCCSCSQEPLRCQSCHQEMELWISNIHGGPYEDSEEAPTCDVCGLEDLVVSGPYFFHCGSCEVDVCEKCADLELGKLQSET